MRIRIVLAATAPLCLLWTVAPGRAADASDLRSAYVEQLEAMQADRAALGDAWYRTLGRMAAAEGERTGRNSLAMVRLSLERAIAGKSIELVLISRANKPFQARAWVAKSDATTRDVSPAGLEFSGTPNKGRAGGSMDLTLVPDDLMSLDGKPMRGRVQLNVTIEKGRATGRYSAGSGLPKTSGNLTGAAVAVDEQISIPRGPPAPKLDGRNIHALYAAAVRIEREAGDLFQQMRHFDAVARSGKDVPAHGVAELLPVRPTFAPGAEGTKGPTRAPKAPEIGGLEGDLGLGLDDDMDLGGPQSPREVKAASKPALDPRTTDRLGTVKAMREHVRLMAAAAHANLEGGDENPVRTGPGAKFEDPQFGPWYGFVPLPEREKQPQVIPADAGGDGVQHWPYVNHWRYLGPVPRRPIGTSVSRLAEVVPTEDATYGEISPSIRQKSYVGPGLLRWTPFDVVEKGNGMWRPPQWVSQRTGFNSAHNGIADSTVYAAAEIFSEKDVELWAAAFVDDEGMLWLNNRLVAVWLAPADPVSEERTKVFKLRFRKGRNVLTVRVDKTGRDTGFFVRVCLRGSPRDRATATAQIAAIEKRIAGITHVPDSVRGWRGNWNGEFPGARPVTAWDIQKGINILWRTPLPKSCAHAVVTGNKVLTMYEKNTLVCLDKMTGDILWERELNILELKDKELYEQSLEKRAEWKKAWDTMVGLGGTWGAQISSLKRAKELDDERAKEELQRMHKEFRDLFGKWWRFVYTNGGCLSRSQWKDWWGLTYATPVTDGKHVWVKCAAGLTACFDLDGNRKWMVETDYPESGEELCSSPVLTGNPYDGTGRLIMELPAGKQTNWEASPLRIVGLDAMTGRAVWEVPYSCNPQSSSSPVPVRLTNGKEEMEVVVTGGGGVTVARDNAPFDFWYEGGTVVRALDGKVLIHSLGTVPGWGSPTRIRNRVLHISPSLATSTELIMVNRDVVGGKRLWARRLAEFDSGLVHHNGVLHGQAGGQWFSGYYMYDADTGRRIPRQVNVGYGFNGGRTYCPIALANGHLFMGDHGTALGRTFPYANMTVTQTGPRGRIVARSKLDQPFSAGPVFDGDRSYYRCEHSLICVAYTGEEGRAYEAEANAREILKDFSPQPPSRAEAKVIKAMPTAPRHTRAHPVVETVDSSISTLGPFSPADADVILAQLGGPARTILREKQEIEFGDSTAVVSTSGRFHNLRKWLSSLKDKPNTVSFLFAVIKNDRPGARRVHIEIPDGDAWLAGTPIADGDRVQLGRGYYPLLVRLRIGDPAPTSVGFRMYLGDSTDCADVEAWYSDVERNRAIFERIIEYKPAGKLAETARAILAERR